MAICNENIVDIDLAECSVHRTRLNRTIGISDELANQYGVRVFRRSYPVDLTGVTVQGLFHDSSGTVTTLTGTVTDNEACVTLTDDCYENDGAFVLAIKLTDGSVMSTVRIIDGTVLNSTTN